MNAFIFGIEHSWEQEIQILNEIPGDKSFI